MNVIAQVVEQCFNQTSRADRRILVSADGARYALEWLQWAQRTGFACLQAYSPNQLHHMAALLHERSN